MIYSVIVVCVFKIKILENCKNEQLTEFLLLLPLLLLLLFQYRRLLWKEHRLFEVLFPWEILFPWKNRCNREEYFCRIPQPACRQLCLCTVTFLLSRQRNCPCSGWGQPLCLSTRSPILVYWRIFLLHQEFCYLLGLSAYSMLLFFLSQKLFRLHFAL